MQRRVKRKRRRRYKFAPRFYVLMALFISAIILLIAFIISAKNDSKPKSPLLSPTPSISDEPTISNTPEITGDEPVNSDEPVNPAQTEEIKVDYPDPEAADESQPSKFAFKTAIQVNGKTVESYQAEDSIFFGRPNEYSNVVGVTTFRGDNYRQNPAYGTVQVTQKKLEDIWKKETGSITKGEGGNNKGSWTGNGWTGQPILVQWSQKAKEHMNMFDSAKSKEGLVEVIYASMDGCIYFMDLETGELTRETLKLNIPFKGAGSLDPRGYPILYLGSGDHYNKEGRESQARAISLIDCKTIFTFGKKTDSFALRKWHAYDSAPLIDGKTDTLIYPAENGIIYRVKLNTQYDEENGTLTMNPDTPVKYRYSATRTKSKFAVGYEGSAVGWRNYIYCTENAGLMQCIDINTMKIKWVCDTWDDTNATAAFEESPENKTAYLYVGSTLDSTKTATSDANVGKGKVGFFKIDAITGEKVWQLDFDVYTTKNVTGGVMSSAVIGKNNVKDLVFTSVASYGNGNWGKVIAIEKDTGNIRWSYDLKGYAWSSPVIVYDSTGYGYLIIGDHNGIVYLLDALSGELYDNSIQLDSNIEASPAVFNDILIIGTRVNGIHALKIK